jgi:hypothetical protein
MATTAEARTPAHLWIVGILSLLWNAFGACDYLMSRTHNVAWMKMTMPKSDPAAMFAYVDSMPLIASFGWGLGVWSSLAGSLLLIMRSRYAVHLFVLALIGAVLSFGYQLFVATNVPPEMQNPVAAVVITVLILLQLWYSWTMDKKGVLR